MALEWELIDDGHKRAKVHGGWLVKVTEEVWVDIHGNGYRPEAGYAWQSSICFVPDPEHQWSIHQ